MPPGPEKVSKLDKKLQEYAEDIEHYVDKVENTFKIMDAKNLKLFNKILHMITKCIGKAFTMFRDPLKRILKKMVMLRGVSTDEIYEELLETNMETFVLLTIECRGQWVTLRWLFKCWTIVVKSLPESTLRKIVMNHMKDLSFLRKSLGGAGEYRNQRTVMLLIFQCTSTMSAADLERFGRELFPYEPFYRLRKIFSHQTEYTVETSIRMCLSEYNGLIERPDIVSIPVAKLQLASHKCVARKGENIWMDFNSVPHNISVYCSSSNEMFLGKAMDKLMLIYIPVKIIDGFVVNRERNDIELFIISEEKFTIVDAESGDVDHFLTIRDLRCNFTIPFDVVDECNAMLEKIERTVSLKHHVKKDSWKNYPINRPEKDLSNQPSVYYRDNNATEMQIDLQNQTNDGDTEQPLSSIASSPEDTGINDDTMVEVSRIFGAQVAEDTGVFLMDRGFTPRPATPKNDQQDFSFARSPIYVSQEAFFTDLDSEAENRKVGDLKVVEKIQKTPESVQAIEETLKTPESVQAMETLKTPESVQAMEETLKTPESVKVNAKSPPVNREVTLGGSDSDASDDKPLIQRKKGRPRGKPHRKVTKKSKSTNPILNAKKYTNLLQKLRDSSNASLREKRNRNPVIDLDHSHASNVKKEKKYAAKVKKISEKAKKGPAKRSRIATKFIVESSSSDECPVKETIQDDDPSPEAFNDYVSQGTESDGCEIIEPSQENDVSRSLLQGNETATKDVPVELSPQITTILARNATKNRFTENLISSDDSAVEEITDGRSVAMKRDRTFTMDSPICPVVEKRCRITCYEKSRDSTDDENCEKSVSLTTAALVHAEKSPIQVQNADVSDITETQMSLVMEIDDSHPNTPEKAPAKMMKSKTVEPKEVKSVPCYMKPVKVILDDDPAPKSKKAKASKASKAVKRPSSDEFDISGSIDKIPDISKTIDKFLQRDDDKTSEKNSQKMKKSDEKKENDTFNMLRDEKATKSVIKRKLFNPLQNLSTDFSNASSQEKANKTPVWKFFKSRNDLNTTPSDIVVDSDLSQASNNEKKKSAVKMKKKIERNVSKINQKAKKEPKEVKPQVLDELKAIKRRGRKKSVVPIVKRASVGGIASIQAGIFVANITPNSSNFFAMSSSSIHMPSCVQRPHTRRSAIM